MRFALEVRPTEIAFDIVTAERALEAIGYRDVFGFNFDPSHLQWQGIDPVHFLNEFSDRVFHVHMKDVAVTLDGRSGILASHLNFGASGRGWDFRSVGRGHVDFESFGHNGIRLKGKIPAARVDRCGPYSIGVSETA